MSVVLLTGATGFVGRAIHRYLERRGHDVRVTVRPGTASRLAVPTPQTAIIETDDIFARDAAWWAKACVGVDAVIHAAWFVEHGHYLNAPENADCVQGSFALAQGAVEAGVAHVIGVGTCMEYRLPGENLCVDAPLEPANFYAACKVATYHMMREWLAHHRQLKAGKQADLSAGTQVRDFLDVRQAGAMIANVVDSGQTGVINICSGEPLTVRAFAERIADSYGRRDLLKFGGQPPRPSDPAAVVGVCNLKKSAELLEFL